jgi:hypothetical protein
LITFGAETATFISHGAEATPFTENSSGLGLLYKSAGAGVRLEQAAQQSGKSGNQVADKPGLVQTSGPYRLPHWLCCHPIWQLKTGRASDEWG